MKKIENITQRISLEIENPQPQLCIPIRQGETARELVFTLLHRGSEYPIAENCTAVFTALKPDGKLIFNNCEIVENLILYPLTAQTAAVAGLLSCQLRLYDSAEKLLLSPRFLMEVEKSVYSDDAVLDSENEVTALTALISESTALIDKIRQDLANSAYIPKFKIGTVSTLPTGSMATASIGGSGAEAILNLGIPQGPQGQAEHLIPDTALSENSTKPVQNCVITEEMNKKLDKAEFQQSIGNFVEREEFSESLSNFVELEKYGNEMGKKVDKISGKGLSTNDFTTAEKQKLAGIEAGANKFSLSSNSVTASKIAYGAVSSSHCLCLDADSWQNLRQSLALSAVADTSAVIVSPREDSFESYCDCSIRCVSQQSGSLTFACKSKPTADVYVNILLINK